MSDVCDAITERRRLLNGLAGESGLTMLRLSSAASPHEDDLKFITVEELDYVLMGAEFELKRLRGEVARFEKLGVTAATTIAVSTSVDSSFEAIAREFSRVHRMRPNED